ncbi:unnamed protein product, partial [Mycena citricolor]
MIAQRPRQSCRHPSKLSVTSDRNPPLEESLPASLRSPRSPQTPQTALDSGVPPFYQRLLRIRRSHHKLCFMQLTTSFHVTFSISGN